MSLLLAARVDDHVPGHVDEDSGLGFCDADALDGAKHVAYECSKSVTGSEGSNCFDLMHSKIWALAKQREIWL